MERSFLVGALLMVMLGSVAPAEQISVKHIQRPTHRFMVARSEDGKVIANVEFSQIVQGDEVSMRLTYHFLDGSIDDETTTYRQQGTFQLVRDHYLQEGPFFSKPFDFTVEDAAGLAISRTEDKHGRGFQLASCNACLLACRPFGLIDCKDLVTKSAVRYSGLRTVWPVVQWKQF
jgi:hypothetical protein